MRERGRRLKCSFLHNTQKREDTRLEAEAFLHFNTQQQYNERWVYTICVTLEYTVHMWTNPNIRGYLTTPQVYLTQDGDINDSHPGYTSGVELDISTKGPIPDAALTQQCIGHMRNGTNFIHQVSLASRKTSTVSRQWWVNHQGLTSSKIGDAAITG